MTTVQALGVAFLALGSGAIGWAAHAVVEDRRMRRFCARLKTEIASHH